LLFKWNRRLSGSLNVNFSMGRHFSAKDKELDEILEERKHTMQKE
jgi:hypothetical protein